MAASPREAFINSIKNDADSFLDFMSQHASRDSCFNLEEILPVLQNTQLDELWINAYQLCHNVLRNAVATADDNPGLCSREEADKAVNIIEAIVSLAKLMIKLDLNTAEHLTQCVTLLHNLLPTFPDNRDKLKNSISQLCEAWWSKGLTKKETIWSNAVMYILQRTLSAKPLKADVIRLWHLRETFKLLLDADLENKEVLWELLEKCALSPVCLSTDEGQKIISLLFQLKVSFTETLHKMVKVNLPNCNMKQAEAYGSIYYRAWLNSTGEIREKLETCCIQDFMYFAVHLPRNGYNCLAFLLQKLLNFFHRRKKQRSVAILLLNLYDPIIWRSLKVANGVVRANAASIFFDVYPLENPETTAEETDKMLQKQFNTIESLLRDPNDKVREIAIAGAAVVLNQHWEVIPVDTIKRLLVILTNELAHDSSSAVVRAAVFKSMRLLLDNPLSHPTLSKILPSLGNCFHDVAEKVRIAFCNLLLKIKLIRTLKYWNVVPMDHLMARLEVDSRSVARHIVNLVYSSFVPLAKPEHIQLERCIVLIEEYRAASRVFFQHLHLYIGIESIVNCIILLGKGLFVYAKISLNNMNDSSDLNSSIQNRENKENMTKENMYDENLSVSSVENGNNLPFDNPDVAVGSLDAMSIMWTSINSKLHEPKHKEHLKTLVGNVARIMPTLFRFFKDKDAWDSLIYLSSFLPSAHVPTFTGHCFSRLKDLPEDSESSAYVNIIDSLCNHGRAGDILELCSEWIKDGFSTEQRELPKRKAKSNIKKKVKFVEVYQSKPLLALGFLETLLVQPLCRETLLSRHVDLTRQLVDQLKCAKNFITKRMQSTTPLKNFPDEFILKAFILHSKLVLLLHTKEDPSRSRTLCIIKNLLEWVERDIFIMLTSLCHSEDGNSMHNSVNKPTDCQKLGLALTEHLLQICVDVILIGFADVDFCTSASQFALQCLKRACSNDKLLLLITKVMYQILGYSMLKSESDLAASVVPAMISSTIQFAMKFSLLDSEKARKLSLEIKPAIFECILEIYGKVDLDDAYYSLINTVISGIIDEITLFVHKHQGFDNCDTISELPAVSSTLLSAIASRKNVMRLFLAEFVDYLKTENMSEPSKLLAASHLVNTISKDKSCKVDKEDLMELVSTITTNLNKLNEQEIQENNNDSLNIDRVYIQSAISVITELRSARTE